MKRIREQLPDGRIVTRTVSYNHPGAAAATSRPASAPLPPASPPPSVGGEPEPEPAAESEAEPEPEPAAEEPAAQEPDPAREAAIGLPGRLRQTDHRLLLGRRDIERLAPGAEAWLRRGATFDAVTAVLTANLPPVVRNPAGLVAHRLTAQLPPPPEPLLRRAAYVPPDPFQTCEQCDRAFRGPSPGTCGDCTDDRAD